MAYATGSTGLAITVRGSSRRIMIMRFRPANIRLINRRSNLPRLLLALSSGKNKSNDKQKQPHRLRRVDTVTPYQAKALIDSVPLVRLQLGNDVIQFMLCSVGTLPRLRAAAGIGQNICSANRS